jgi:predicted transcriptional regulator
MSQVELAKASTTDQSLIAHIESGSRDTRTKTLDRLLSTMGYQMVAIDSMERTALDATLAIRMRLVRQRPDEAGEELVEFSEGLRRIDAATVIALTHSRPPTTEHPGWDAAIAL